MSTIERLLALKAMSVGGGGVKYATGTVIHTSGYTLTITHNLGTRKAFCIAQRVNENGETILAEGGSAYNAIFLMGATTDEFVNHDQVYAVDASSDGYQLVNSTNQAERTCPIGMFAYFKPAASTNAFLPTNPLEHNVRYPEAVDDNTIIITANYSLQPGRWVWHIWGM